MGTSSSQPAKAPDFTERVAGYQYCCAFSPQGTYCAFGGADRRMRLVARRPGMIGHDDEMRVTPVPGTVEWCGYTVEGVLLATVFNSADSSKQLLAWGTPARGNFQGQLLTSAAISLHPTLPAELAGPITMSRDRSMLAVVAVTGENGSTVYTVRISKVKFAGEHLLYLPFLFAAGTFPAVRVRNERRLVEPDPSVRPSSPPRRVPPSLVPARPSFVLPPPSHFVRSLWTR